MHEHAKSARTSWIADHIDSTMAQTLASRAYHAVNRVCVGRAKRIRFRSRGRGLDSVEGKRNDVGMRFVLDPGVGNGGFLLWQTDVIAALIDWHDPIVQHGLRHPIKYVRLVRRKASSPRAQGADHDGNRYFVQLVLEGHPFIKKKHAYLDPEHTIPSITHAVWEGAEPLLRVVVEGLHQRANEGHPLPRSMGLLASQAARARARRLESSPDPQQEPLSLSASSAEGESGNVG